MSDKIRVLIVDDHQLIREGLRLVLELKAGFEVVGEAGTGRDAIDRAASLRPDVVLLDVQMPDMNGLEAIGKLPSSSKVVVLSMSPVEEYVLRALRAGAHGYVVKNTSHHELEAAIRAAVLGERYLSPVATSQMVSAYLGEVKPGDERTSLERLTPRQRETLQLIAEGKTNKDIAHAMGITVRTVESTRAQLMKSLDIHDVASLTRYAVKMGLIVPE